MSVTVLGGSAMLAGPPETMSEVFFCNLCDQSVPLVEIQDGTALRVENRVLCAACRALLAQGGGRRRGYGGMLAALLACGALGVVGWLWYEGREQRSGADARWGGELSQLRGELAQLGKDLRGRADQEQAERALIGTQVGALRDEVTAATSAAAAQATELTEALAPLQPLPQLLDELRRRTDDLEAGASVAEDRQRSARSALDSLREQVAALNEQLTAAQTAKAEQQAAAATSFSPEVAALLRDLQHEDGRVRYAALEKLEKVQDERLLPHVYPLLADPYEFVRFLAASLLGDWNVRPAAPHLIEALLDEKNFVRDAAARSLRRITGQSIPFDKDAPEAERQQAYQAWKTWWEQNGAGFVSAG